MLLSLLMLMASSVCEHSREEQPPVEFPNSPNREGAGSSAGGGGRGAQ